MDYATHDIPIKRSVSDNLRIYMLANKHGLSIAEVEYKLTVVADNKED